MPEVQSVGAVDYNPYQIQAQQNQLPEQYMVDDSMPPVYDPDLEAKKKSASSGLGLKLLGTVLLGTALVYGGYRMGKSSSGGDVDKIKNAAKELVGEADKMTNSFCYRHKNAKSFAQNVKDKLGEFVGEAEKTAEEVVEGAAKSDKKAPKKPTHF